MEVVKGEASVLGVAPPTIAAQPRRGGGALPYFGAEALSSITIMVQESHTAMTGIGRKIRRFDCRVGP
jgi:hypothetical protein